MEPAEYRITSPGTNSCHEIYELEFINNEVREYKSEYKVYIKDPDQFERAVFFATDIGTSYYFWDLREVTNMHANEYKIYILYRNDKVEYLADSFQDLVLDVWLGSGIPGYDNSHDEGFERILITP